MTTRLEHRLLGKLAEASRRWRLLEPGDRVLVAVSGGKDSLGLLRLLRVLQGRAPFPFDLLAVHLDQGHPGFPRQTLPDWFAREGVPFRVVEEDTYSIVKRLVPEGKTACSLCSRLRRGILYNVAVEHRCTKIALGHHRDDVIETLLLNLFYSGQLKAMPPRLRSDDGRNVVIRPLVLAAEADLAAYAEEQGFPVIPCNLCGSQPEARRQRVKALLADLERENPHLRGNLLAALGNLRPGHLLGADSEEPRGPDPTLDEASPSLVAPARLAGARASGE